MFVVYTLYHNVLSHACCSFKAEVTARLPAPRDLDTESVNPGEAIFEKLVSGLYLGEVRYFGRGNALRFNSR